MHTVDLLEQATAVARQLGYGIRQEWLGGAGGGFCEFGGKRWIFIDLALNQLEQLDQVIEALRNDPATHSLDLPVGIDRLLNCRHAA